MRLLPTVFFLLFIITVSAQEPVVVKYYQTEQDFIRGTTMEATELTGREYIRAFFDSDDKPVSKSKVDVMGNLIWEEIFEYDHTGNLIRKLHYNGQGEIEMMYVYGSEDMSMAFIEYNFPEERYREFRDRITQYDYLPDGEIDSYQFYSVDGTKFGAIFHDYFDKGNIKEERWISYPGGKIVRLFRTYYDPESRFCELTEYDSTGAKVSHVGVVIPEEEKGRDVESGKQSGLDNMLEESSEIIKDIRERVVAGWKPQEESGTLLTEEIQKSSDTIYLKNGQILEGDLIQMNDKYVRFKLLDDDDILVIPLPSVGEIEQRDGKVVYPVIY